MIRKSALAASIAALLTPAVAGALGLGNIEVNSALNEPLQARIPLRGATPGQFEELRVALADDQQFSRAGLDRVYVLTRLRFEVVESGSGSGFIVISTREPVAEPFLNFLVDVNWPRGRVLREYTVLLDPPVYGAAINTGTRRKVRTADALPPATPPSAAVTAPLASAPRAAAPMVSTPEQGAPRYTGDSYGPVRQGETLWSIADRIRPEGTSIQSTMLALLRANPEAFSLDNVNALRTGAVLRIPPASEMTGSKAAALEEVARQHALWAEYRQSVSGAVSPQPGGAPPAASAASSAPPGAAPAAAAGDSSGELKLVGAGTSGAATGGGADVDALRNELTMAQEEADAAKRENQELQSRLTEVESLVGDLQRLVELKEDQLAALQDQLAKAGEQAAQPPVPAAPATAPEPKASEPETKATETMTPAAPAQPAAVAKAPEAPAVKPAVKKKRPAPPPPRSLMDDINDMLPVPAWTLLAGLGAILLTFGGLRFARGRKAKAAAAAAGVPAVADAESMSERFAPTEVPETRAADDGTELPAAPPPDAATLLDIGEEDEDEGQTDQTSTARTSATPTGDEDNPLAEVNVYLAYERFDQAEQLVRDAIASHPQRHDYKLKLLEVFYAAKNLGAFETAAGELRDAVGPDHEMMQQAREWWSDLGADRELFAGGGPPTAKGLPAVGAGDDVFDVTSSESGEETGVDFDLGFDAGDGTDSQGTSSLDFDLGADDGTPSRKDDGLDIDLGSLGGAAAVAGGAAAIGGAAAAAGDSKLDFDLGSDADDDGGATGLDFDLTWDAEASPDADPARATIPERAAAEDDTGLDFDLGSFDDDAAGAATGIGGGSADSELDFDLGDTGDTSARGAGEAGTLHDDAGEESGLDFDLGDTQTTDGAPAGAAAEDAGALDFDLSDTQTTDGAPAAAAADDLDFDLGDTQDTARAATGDTSELDFDLGDTGPGSTGGASALDFDLGDTGGGEEGAGSALDFDLGDTGAGAAEEEPGALDFDLGDTGAGAAKEEPGELDFDLGDTGAGAAKEEPGELDFDLGDTHDSVGHVRAPTAEGAGTSGDADVDFDLGDTFGPDAATAGEDSVAELDVDLSDTVAGVRGGAQAGDESEDLGLDLGLGGDLEAPDGASLSPDDTGGAADLEDVSLDLGAATGDGDNLTLDAFSDDGLPELDLGEDDGPAFDTVKLDSDAADSIRDAAGDGGVGEGSEFGVDTEFQSIFAAGDDGAGTGSGSVLDFDLGSADLGASADDSEPTVMSELESTQFMLQDVSDDGIEDEDDHTLVLGRGASGEVDEIQTKLDLAQAYMDMGDTEGARNLLGEVMAEGDDPQKEQAGEMLKKLS